MLFHEICGQDDAISLLRNAVTTERVGNAYLFAGPEGVGKYCSAIAFAHALLCEDREKLGCLSCNSCLSIEARAHPNFMILAPSPGTKSLVVAQAREAQRFLGMRATGSSSKVVIIDQAHALTLQAQSALLKVLEAPPENSILLLVATTAAGFSAPFLSRCQQVRFLGLSIEHIETIIKDSADLDAETVNLVARYARGSIGKALQLHAPTLEEELEYITNFLGNLGSSSFTRLSEFAEWIIADRVSRAKNKHGDTKLQHGRRLELVLTWYQERLRYCLVGGEGVTLYSRWLPALTIGFTELSVGRALSALMFVHDTVLLLDRNANPRLAVEDMLLQLAKTC